MVVILVSNSTIQAQSLGTAFTYQGKLNDGGNVANGKYDLEFKLYDALTAGSQIDVTKLKKEVNVYDGYFTVALDFGSLAFNGDGRWLAIGVRPGELADPNVYTPLTPRQELTPTPYALQTRGIFVDDYNNVGIGTTTPAAKLTVAGGILRAGSTMYGNSAATHINLGTVSTTGTDGYNTLHSTVGGGWNNTASGYSSTVGGGNGNTASKDSSTVGGGYINRAGGRRSTVGG
ncbi:MAG: hypothetical protein GY869_14070, partial [Planctomycetes bacterium]|nr:hypothetical protein [Planctomycetota bacterium]